MPNVNVRAMSVGCALIGAVALTACGGDGHASVTSAEQAREQALVVIGRAGTASGAPIANAIVTIQVLFNGKPGGEFGCTGDKLLGYWSVQPPGDGLFVSDLRVTALAAPMCLVVLSTRSGDPVWRDTTTLVTRFRAVTDGVAPDTVRLDLRFSR